MEGKLMVIRRLVSLDIVLHGPRFILLEFGVGTPFILRLGFLLMITSPFLLGLYLFLTGLNYIPLLAFAIVTVRKGSSASDVAEEMARNKHYVRKYSLQQLLIFIPFTIILLALYQELMTSRRPKSSGPRPYSMPSANL